MKKKNQGVSMVEIIVVVAIIAIMLVGFTLMPSLISKKRVSETADKISYQLNLARTESMGKLGVNMVIENRAGELYITVTDYQEVCVSTEGIELFYTKQKNNTELSIPVKLTEGESLSIAYNRDTGGLEPLEVEAGGDKVYLSRLICRKGTLEKVIQCVAKTGKNTIQ